MGLQAKRVSEFSRIAAIALMLAALLMATVTVPMVQGETAQNQAVQRLEQHVEIGALNRRITRMQAMNRIDEVLPLAHERVRAVKDLLGEDHPNYASAVSWLGTFHRRKGEFIEAETHFKHAIELTRRHQGDTSPDLGSTMGSLGSLYRAMGRFQESEQLFTLALAVAEQQGPDHPDIAQALSNLAGLNRAIGRLGEVEAQYKRALAILEKRHGANHENVATTLNNLAALYASLGRVTEAEVLYKRAIAVQERVLGPDHNSVGVALNNLAQLLQKQRRFSEAETLTLRAVTIAVKSLGPNHPEVAVGLNNLAGLYGETDRPKEAEQFHLRALAIRERALGSDHPHVAQTLSNLGAVYRMLDRDSEAEALQARALAIEEKAYGPDHPAVGTSLNNLGSFYYVKGRLDDAEKLLSRAISIAEKSLGPEHPDVALRSTNMAAIAFDRRKWAEALNFARRAARIRISVSQREARSGFASSEGGSNQLTQNWDLVTLIMRSAWHLAAAEPASAPALVDEAFMTAQRYRQATAGAALAQMALRQATGDARLAELVRERQDLVRDWQVRDLSLIDAVSLPPDQRSASLPEQRARLTEVDDRIGQIDTQLKREFPEYAALAHPEPLSIAGVQAEMRPDEAMVLTLDTWAVAETPEETFVWVVTKTSARWLRSAMGRSALAREVAALRCGLDKTAWHEAGAMQCQQLLGTSYTLSELELFDEGKGGAPLPFPVARAHALHQALIGEAKDLIRGKHLLLVPSGPLTQLPFQVLVSEPPPSNGGLKSVEWLARQHALTVLPSAASLKSLRGIARLYAASLPMIGFGNPLLDGNQSDLRNGPWYKQAAALARDPDHQSCRPAPGTRIASHHERRARAAPILTRSGLADLAHLRLQTPLPETADEICAVARDLKADVGDMRLGSRATETEVKALSASGALARYRIVHFATHGFIAGQLDGTSEPGLVLTPPETATLNDDGYLTATEVAGLKLDADWVILSACNTAAGGAKGAEALGGLARAFFYAQARALLVSHWEVYSDAAVKLVSRAVGEIARDKDVGRAQALRLAMLALIDNGEPREAHPAYWAPFVVVGEGAAEKGVAQSLTPATGAAAVVNPTPSITPSTPSRKSPAATKKALPPSKNMKRPPLTNEEDWKSRVFRN